MHPAAEHRLVVVGGRRVQVGRPQRRAERQPRADHPAVHLHLVPADEQPQVRHPDDVQRRRPEQRPVEERGDAGQQLAVDRRVGGQRGTGPVPGEPAAHREGQPVRLRHVGDGGGDRGETAPACGARRAWRAPSRRRSARRRRRARSSRHPSRGRAACRGRSRRPRRGCSTRATRWPAARTPRRPHARTGPARCRRRRGARRGGSAWPATASASTSWSVRCRVTTTATTDSGGSGPAG